MSGLQKRVLVCLLFFTVGLCLGGTSFSQEPGWVIVADVQGNVQVKVGDSWQPLQTGMILHERDQIETDPNGSTILFLDGSGKAGRILLQEKGFLALGILSTGPGANDRTTRLDLAIGQVLIHSEKLSDDSSFEVKTPTATVGVRGTIFFVGVSSRGDTSAGALQGMIGVRERETPRAEILVKEDQETFIQSGRAAEAKPMSHGRRDDMTVKAADLFNIQPPAKPSSPTGFSPSVFVPPPPSGLGGQGAGGGYSPLEQHGPPGPPEGHPSPPEQPNPPRPGGSGGPPPSPPEQPPAPPAPASGRTAMP